MIQIYGTDNPGYNPVFPSNDWLLAISNYKSPFPQHGKIYFGRHNTTDEVFVLIEGEARMHMYDEANGIHEITPFERGKLYVVPKGQWHNAELMEGAKLLIAENQDTSDTDSTYIDIDTLTTVYKQ